MADRKRASRGSDGTFWRRRRSEKRSLNLLTAPVGPAVAVSVDSIPFLYEALVIAFQLTVEFHAEGCGRRGSEASPPPVRRPGRPAHLTMTWPHVTSRTTTTRASATDDGREA